MKKTYLILGFGKSGKAAGYFLLKNNEKVIAFDDRYIKDEKIYVYQNYKDINFENVKTLVISPGISNKHIIARLAIENNIEIISEIELGFRYLKNKCIGITGTNGKTTLVSMISHILNDNNIKAKALGNIGNSLTEYLMNFDENDVLVLELSSFQLEHVMTKVLDIACIINITPDHLDRYDNFLSYVKAKINILNILKNENNFFASRDIGDYLSKEKCNLISDDLSEIAKSICVKFDLSKKEIKDSLKKFKRPPHRLEFVAKKNNVSFYNDSKATNIESVIYAVNNFNKNIIIIVGGKDKKLSYKKWNNVFKNKIKHIIAIGQAAEKIREDLQNFNVEIFNSLDLAVSKAFKIAKKKDIVLFSPGCSSFDMYKNYEHRGEEFKRIVYTILKRE